MAVGKSHIRNEKVSNLKLKNGLIHSRACEFFFYSPASFYVAVSIILVCGKIWTKAGNISFLCYFGRLPSQAIRKTRMDIKNYPKIFKNPQQMILIIMFIRSDRSTYSRTYTRTYSKAYSTVYTRLFQTEDKNVKTHDSWSMNKI